MTAAFVARLQGLPTKVIDTRKTTPGLRLLEKYAVRVGGGYNHRFNLADGVLLKDNHLAALRNRGLDLAAAIRTIKHRIPHTMKVEVEITSLDQIDAALAGGADVILLDNMSNADMRTAVARIGGRAQTECSGTVTLETVRERAETGVDLISSGALTHSARALDLSLEIDIWGPRADDVMTAERRPVYLDHASTTPVHPAVRRAMEPYLQHEFGNPSSLSPLGRRAAAALDQARAQVAGVLGCHDDEIVFTGGGSESDNLALKGVALARPGARHLVTTTIEHSAVLGAARDLQDHFGRRRDLRARRRARDRRPGGGGRGHPARHRAGERHARQQRDRHDPARRRDRADRQRARGARAHRRGAGRRLPRPRRRTARRRSPVAVRPQVLRARRASACSYVRRGTPLVPLIHGGDQERGRRAGTENVAGIVACGAALELVEAAPPATCARLGALRDRLIDGIEASVPGALLER